MAEQLYETNLSVDLEHAAPDSTPLRVRQGESIGINITVKYDRKPLVIPAGATCVLDVWVAGTPGVLYVNDTGTIVDASKGKIRFELSPSQTNFTAGEYKGQARIVSSDNLNIATVWYGDYTSSEAPTGVGVGFVGVTSGLELDDLDDVDMTGVQDGEVVVASVASDGSVTYGPGAGAGGADNLGDHTATQALDMGTFAITNVGNVDGRDVSADGSKLDGIEALADVTDATNVNAAGAVMETDYGAHTILAATANNTPLPVTLTNKTIVGKQTGDGIVAIGQVSGAEITAGTETDLRAFSPADVKSVVDTHGGGGGSESWFSPVQGLHWDYANASGSIGWKPEEISTGSYEVAGEGLQSSSGTQQNGTARGTIIVPAHATSLHATKAFELDIFSTSVASGAPAEYDFVIHEYTEQSSGAWGAKTEIYSVTNQITASADVPETISVGTADLASGASTIASRYTYKIVFRSQSDEFVAYVAGGANGA